MRPLGGSYSLSNAFASNEHAGSCDNKGVSARPMHIQVGMDGMCSIQGRTQLVVVEWVASLAWAAVWTAR